MSKVALGFIPEPRHVSLGDILPSRKAPEGLALSRKFKQIVSSIEEVGLIEPLTVSPLAGAPGRYTLLDGHMRLLALKELQVSVAPCLEATDDESYTYNNRINRLSSVQEHLMIRRALERGVSPERLAKALNVDVSHVRKKLNLLEGICPEAAAQLEDRQFSAELCRVLRKMKPMRQVECVELMTSANNLSVPYAEALFAATPDEMLVEPKQSRRLAGISKEQLARMEREMQNVQAQYRLVEQSYGQDVLLLVLVRGYLAKLVGNQEVARFLRSKSPEILEQFQVVVSATSLDS
jgi:ParB-like chromosome segregation protein Spo0J